MVWARACDEDTRQVRIRCYPVGEDVEGCKHRARRAMMLELSSYGSPVAFSSDGHHAAWVKLVKFLINDGIS